MQKNLVKFVQKLLEPLNIPNLCEKPQLKPLSDQGIDKKEGVGHKGKGGRTQFLQLEKNFYREESKEGGKCPTEGGRFS